jgi:hypothetical protein
MRTIIAVLLPFVLLSCTTQRVIPDQRIPHRVAEEASVKVWARKPDGSMHMITVDVPEGWWVAGPLVVGE